MADYIALEEDQQLASVLASDGWSRMSHGPINPEVGDHIARCFGQAETILHETISKFFHLDIHVIPPVPGRDFTTYVTSGMSDLSMNAPTGFADWERAELIMALAGTPDQHIDAGGQRHYMIEHLRNYARRPHAMGSCFILGQTIGGGDFAEPVGPDTAMSAYVLSRPIVTPIGDSMEAFRASLSNGASVNFLALEPIHADELALKADEGSDVLIERLEAAGVFELYDPHRASVAARKTRGFSLKRLLGG